LPVVEFHEPFGSEQVLGRFTNLPDGFTTGRGQREEGKQAKERGGETRERWGRRCPVVG